MPKQQNHHRKLRLEALEKRELLTNYFVDGDGSTSGDGTFGNPFNTIQAGANAAAAGDTVFIRAGTYREEVNLPRSGEAANPITFQAYNNEEVVLSGGDLVTGWTPVAGTTDVWVASVNWNANNNRDANTLFVNGELKHQAKQFAENDPLDIDDWGLLDKHSLSDNASSFIAADLAGYPDNFWNGARIKFHQTDYSFYTKTIADYSSNGRITFDSPIGNITLKQDDGYYIYDAFKALDKPGEWYKGKSEDGAGEPNKLYYKAEPGQNPNTLQIEFKQRGYAFDAENRDYIAIKDLTFRGASIDANGNTDHNLFEANTFYAYDKDNFGRFTLSGDFNTVRDSEFSQTWGSFLTVGGRRNAIVNNYIHDIGFNATTRAISSSSAEELLVSYNTVRNFARSFMDGYPLRSDISYNLFEDGGNLSWDTGVFDSDGGNGDSSYSIFHHNVFRDNGDSRGIYEAFYGRNNNAVIHHNLFYNYQNGSRTVLSAGGTEYRQVYNNTVITDFNSAPTGELEARDAIGTRYDNNIQSTLAEVEALGTEVRGNYNYSPADFNNFAQGDFTLAPGSGAIDSGIVIPGVTDNVTDGKPDAGAFEAGQSPWVAGHNFADPPNPVYSWKALPGTNLFDNGQFLQGIGDWTIVSGTPNSKDRNSWNLQQSGAALTGAFRTQSVEFTPGEGMKKTFTNLQPNTAYTIGAAVRLANRVGDADDYDQHSGSITTGEHRGERYVTNMSDGEWVKYGNVDFGEPGQYDQLDVLHIRNPSKFSSSLDGVKIQVRLGSPTGQLLTEFSDLADGQQPDRWRANRAAFSGVSGLQDLYVSVTGGNSTNLAVGSFRLLNDSVPADDRLTIKISSNGAPTQISRLGDDDWQSGYEDIVFTTGPSATSAVVEFNNQGRLNAYLDRLYLVEGYSTRGADPCDVSTGALAYRSVTTTSGELDSNLTDGSPATETAAGNHPGSWVQVDLGKAQAIYNINLTAPTTQPGRLSNFRVSVWSSDPLQGGTMLWSQDYLTAGQTLSSGEVLHIQADALGSDGGGELNSARGRFVRVELLGPNSLGGNQLALGELQVNSFDLGNLATSDSVTSQSTTAEGLSAELAVDNEQATYSETQAATTNSWWQTRFSQPFSIGQIEIQNRGDASFSDLSNFTVSVWDEDPAAGGNQLWEKSYFATGSVGQGDVFLIDGGEQSDSSTRRLASVHTGRLVRIQLNGTNNNGNGRLSLANVRVAAGDEAPPLGNAAQRGVATQEKNFYGDTSPQAGGFARDANDGLIFPLSNFTSTLPESGTWWQVDLQEAAQIDQIVVYNRTDAASRLDNFRVSVWSGDPDDGGSKLWERSYDYSSNAPTYSTGTTIGPGGALLIDGSDADGGLRLDNVVGGRYVRVQLDGSNILSLPEVQVWTPAERVAIDPSPTVFNFDLGASTSPVEGGWTGVAPTSYGDAWWYGKTSAEDKPSAGVNNINRDFVAGTQAATLNLNVPNGRYSVTANLGDSTTDRDHMQVWAEGALIDDDVNAAAGQFPYVSYQVDVRDGVFNLRLDDAGNDPGAAPGWALTRLSLTRIGDLPTDVDTSLTQFDYDLGSAASPLASGYAMLTPDTYGDISWSSSVNAVLRGSGGSLYQDFVSSNAATTLEHKVANGIWDVTITSGDAELAHDNLSIAAEGVLKIDDLDTLAGQFAERTFRVQVSDGSLSLDLADNGGANPDWALNRLSLVKISDLPIVAGDFNADQMVDDADLAQWESGYGGNGLADANQDRQVDGFDFLTWQRNAGLGVSHELIGATTNNGSFEDHTGSTGLAANPSAKRVFSNGNPAAIPGWTLVAANGLGGWDSADGVASDGLAYAFANDGVEIALTSTVVNSYSAVVGDQLTLQVDVGSSTNAAHDYSATLVLGSNSYSLGTIADATDVGVTGSFNTIAFSYTVTAADAGTHPQLELLVENGGGNSKAYLDNIRLTTSKAPPAAAAGTASSTLLAAIEAPTTDEPLSPVSSNDAGVVWLAGAPRYGAGNRLAPAVPPQDAAPLEDFANEPFFLYRTRFTDKDLRLIAEAQLDFARRTEGHPETESETVPAATSIADAFALAFASL